MIFRIYLRSHVQGEQGRVDAKTNTHTPGMAEKAYRALLSREDLLGHPWAAVLSKDNHSIYFSRFDRDLGGGRIHPDAPLDLFRDDDGTREATLWRPAEIDWDAPFPELQKQWMAARGLTNDAASALLAVPSETWKSWRYGKSVCSYEGTLRKLMKLV